MSTTAVPVEGGMKNEERTGLAHKSSERERVSEERNTRRGPAGGNTPGPGPRPLAVVLRALGDADVTPTDVQL